MISKSIILELITIIFIQLGFLIIIDTQVFYNKKKHLLYESQSSNVMYVFNRSLLKCLVTSGTSNQSNILRINN